MMKSAVEYLKEFLTKQFQRGQLTPSCPLTYECIKCVEESLCLNFNNETGEWSEKMQYKTSDYRFHKCYESDAYNGTEEFIEISNIDESVDDQDWYFDNEDYGQREFIYETLGQFGFHDTSHACFEIPHQYTIDQAGHLLLALGFEKGDTYYDGEPSDD